MTLVEILVVTAVVVLIALILLPVIPHRHKPVGRVACVNNLKQMALAALIYANDSAAELPWTTANATNGTMHLRETSQVFRHFLALSNELNTPKVLFCRDDIDRKRAEQWQDLDNSRLSYFINVSTSSNSLAAQNILFGDRNVTGGVLSNQFMLTLQPKSRVQWTKDIHNHFGNLAFTDGSAHFSVSSNALQAILATNTQPIRLAFP